MFGWVKQWFGRDERLAREQAQIDEALAGTLAMARAMEEKRKQAKAARMAKARPRDPEGAD